MDRREKFIDFEEEISFDLLGHAMGMTQRPLPSSFVPWELEDGLVIFPDVFDANRQLQEQLEAHMPAIRPRWYDPEELS